MCCPAMPGKALLPVYEFARCSEEGLMYAKRTPRCDRAVVIIEWGVVMQLEQSRR